MFFGHRESPWWLLMISNPNSTRRSKGCLARKTLGELSMLYQPAKAFIPQPMFTLRLDRPWADPMNEGEPRALAFFSFLPLLIDYAESRI
jgi:hypothetical protein